MSANVPPPPSYGGPGSQPPYAPPAPAYTPPPVPSYTPPGGSVPPPTWATSEPTPVPPKKRSGGKIAVVIVAVLAVVAGGVFAVSALVGGDSDSGGAENPEAAVQNLFDAVSKDLPFKSGDRVALMINGLGGTPPSELYVLYRQAALRSKKLGLNIVRNYIGNYCTSLEMAGASLTLLKLDKEIEELLAAPAEIATRVF